MQTQDPANRFLSRQNHFRLQAEFVRDQALQVSGLLAPLLGGKECETLSARRLLPASEFSYSSV